MAVAPPATEVIATDGHRRRPRRRRRRAAAAAASPPPLVSGDESVLIAVIVAPVGAFLLITAVLVALFFGYRGRWLRKKVAKAAPPQAIAAAQGKNKMMIRSLTQQFLSTESGAAAAAGNAAAGKAVSKIIFDQYDRDGSGFIESDELKQLCDAMGKGLTAEQLTRVFAALDKNVDEKISYDEFSVWWELGLDIDALHDPEAARKKIAEEKELARQEAERESAGESRSAHDLADDERRERREVEAELALKESSVDRRSDAARRRSEQREELREHAPRRPSSTTRN